jgi:hypothetical protein
MNVLECKSNQDRRVWYNTIVLFSVSAKPSCSRVTTPSLTRPVTVPQPKTNPLPKPKTLSQIAAPLTKPQVQKPQVQKPQVQKPQVQKPQVQNQNPLAQHPSPSSVQHQDPPLAPKARLPAIVNSSGSCWPNTGVSMSAFLSMATACLGTVKIWMTLCVAKATATSTVLRGISAKRLALGSVVTPWILKRSLTLNRTWRSRKTIDAESESESNHKGWG